MGTTTNVLVPTRHVGLSALKPISLSLINTHGCAVAPNRSIWCWGNNASGQLGDGTTTTRLNPVVVSGSVNDATKVVTSGDATCALTLSCDIKCWGSNTLGLTAQGTNIGNTSVPIVSSSAGLADDLWSGFRNMYLKECNLVRCWGDNSKSQLGTSASPETTPKTMPFYDVRGIAVGGYNLCFHLEATKRVSCMGWNLFNTPSPIVWNDYEY
jgi:alpha-tubulin suppressor-like RCC1 family protein